MSGFLSCMLTVAAGGGRPFLLVRTVSAILRSTARPLCSGCPLPHHEWISFLVGHYRLMSGNFLLYLLCSEYGIEIARFRTVCFC